MSFENIVNSTISNNVTNKTVESNGVYMKASLKCVYNSCFFLIILHIFLYIESEHNRHSGAAQKRKIRNRRSDSDKEGDSVSSSNGADMKASLNCV